jgi:general secretion pathway protein G
MRYRKSKKAFTMIELVFVIVIIGILASVAIPRLAATRDDADITKARTFVATIRSAVSIERQKRILRGDFDPIFRLTDTSTLDHRIFNAFDENTSFPILENPPFSCAVNTDKDCWYEKQTGTLATAKNTDSSDDSQYTYNLPIGGSVDFNLSNNRFVCSDPNSDNCKLLTQ